MAANDNAVTCGKELGLLELFVSAIGTDASGKPTLRLYKSSDTGVDFSTCSKNLNAEEIARNLFTLDSNGKIAVRVSILP